LIKSINILIYETDKFYFLRKQHGLPTTFWKQTSFLDSFKNIDNINQLKEEFSEAEEYWLLNRLDNDTSGLLYFAKNKEIKQKYIEAQKEGNIRKIYLADIAGRLPDPMWQKFVISNPIAHHRYFDDRMVVLRNQKDENKIRWKIHKVQTNIEVLYYDKKQDITTLQITISKGVRHQIRSHLASIWYPIIWDKIYSKIKNKEVLHLWSIWLVI